MSRKNEYRVWDKQDKNYRQIAALTFGGKYVYLYPGEGCYLTPEDERHGMCGGAGFKMTDSTDRDRLVFEQYTGLKDKNGKKVYEGDIFQNDYDGGYDVVKWVEGHAGFRLCYMGDEDESESLGLYKMDELEIIGNIHENPELLEEV